MSYLQSRWDPPPAAPVYRRPGVHPRIPYVVPWPFAVYPDGSPGPPKDEYWATELKENPLGLENMHIRADSSRKEANVSRSSARAPTSYSRASDYAVRNSYPPNSSTRTTLAPSNSQPNTRVPSPARPRQSGREIETDRNVVVSNDRYDTYPAPTAHNGGGNSSQRPSVYPRPPSRAHDGRSNVPVEAGMRYISASASAAVHATQMSSRSQTIPGAESRRSTGPSTSEAGLSQAQEMQRSKTMPEEALGANLRRDQSMTTRLPRRSSDRYAYRQPQNDYEESEAEDEQDPALSGWQRVEFGNATEKEARKEKKALDHVRTWATNVRHLGSSQHGRDNDHPRERQRRTMPGSKSIQESYGHSHEAGGENDGYGDDRMYVVHGASAPQYTHERDRARAIRSTSTLDPIPDITSRASRDQNGRYGVLAITEEPKDMYGYSRNHQESISVSQSQQSRPVESPRRVREHDWAYRENDYSSGSSNGSSNSASDDESEQDYNRSFGRTGSMRQRDNRVAGTPHPAPPRRLTERGDTLQVDNGTGNFTLVQGKAHLPSPRSLRRSSRTPSSRPSIEQVRNEREQELQRSNTPNRHLAVGTSSASGAAAAGLGNGTPPITPTRQEQIHRTASARPPYAPQPVASGPAEVTTRMAEPAPAFQTPTRPAYLYGESSASPSPAAPRVATTQPHQNPPSYGNQQPLSRQYSISGYNPSTEAKPRRRSPHAPRAASPLPSGLGTSSSSAYYAALDERTNPPSRANSRSRGQPHEHAHNQSHSYSHSRGHSRHSGSQAVVPPNTAEYDGHRRSSSRAAVLAGSGYSSASGAAAAASHSAAIRGSSDDGCHVRSGYWNRRGDHLTETGYVVYCPPGRCYPPHLKDYPDSAFKNHLGNIVKATPDQYPELPESIPKYAGRAPEKAYDSFVKYVLVRSKS